MKDQVMFTACDTNNLGYATKLIKSFKYFHPDIPVVLFTNARENLPGGVIVKDISEVMIRDKDFFYKQKPYCADVLFHDGYNTILGLDSDQIVLGSLDYLFAHTDYDIGTVLNFNPFDFKVHGPITTPPIHYATEYFNAGLVMMRSRKFVKQWLKLCNGPFFKRLNYREQDLLNYLCYFGDYTYFCFDDANSIEKYFAWHGLLGSSETLEAILKDKDIIIPKNEKTGYPSVDVLFKVWHAAGGQVPFDKLNYRVKFKPEVVERINEILK